MAETKIPGDEEMREVLSDIVSDANRASSIIAGMRGLMTRMAPFREALQMGGLIRDVLALAERELTQRRISVRLEIAKDLPQIWGDRVQLQQMILNLVMNAAEAMGEVPDARRILTIATRSSERNSQSIVLVTVHDLGSGFAADNAEGLFEALYTTKADGLGMGLRISRSIAEAHGGSLWAEVNDDVGATFFFALPGGRPDIDDGKG
jgi:C4-dicarboxylate-specific signal transduction histidine kinase